MILELLLDIHKVLQTCGESINRQNKANDQLYGYLQATQQAIQSFVKVNKELNQELTTIQEHQERLLNYFIQLGILSPMENETVYSYAERIVHLIHTQNKQHKKETKDCQELLEENGVLLFQSEDLFEGIRTLIDNLKRNEETKGDQRPEFNEEKSKLEAEMNCIKAFVNLGMDYGRAEQWLQTAKSAIRIEKEFGKARKFSLNIKTTSDPQCPTVNSQA